jgi:hypothetical protein
MGFSSPDIGVGPFPLFSTEPVKRTTSDDFASEILPNRLNLLSDS